MTSLNGYIQGLGSGADRIVRKTGKEVKLSVFDNIDDVIVFNQEGETKQTTLTGKNLFNINDLTDSRITVDGNVAYATISVFYNDYKIEAGGLPIATTFEQNTQYTISLQLKYEENSQSGKGIGFKVYYTDNTNSTIIPTSSFSNTDYISLSGTTAVGKTVSSFSVTFSNVTSVVVYLKEIQIETGSTATQFEEYCGGVPSPNPDYPQDIVGIGTKRQDGTYRVDIDYYDDERDERITASGLAYPLYEGDILDFANGKVIRANGYKKFDGSETWADYSDYGLGFQITISDLLSQTYGDGKSNRFIRATDSAEMTTKTNVVKFGDNNNKVYFAQVNISGVSDLASWKTWLANNNTYIVYPLATPTDEYITLSGDISNIGTATVEADGTLTVKYDKVEMAIRKYSSPPDWSKIGYSETPSFILDGFNYSKQIYDSWTSAASYASKFRGDKALKFFPEVDLTGATNYSAMFQESGILSTPPLTIGDGSNTVINSQLMFQSSPIEKIELTTSEATQKVQIANIFNGCTMLKNAKLTLSASGSMQYAFADCNRLERIEDGLETSDVTSFSEAFRACSSLLYLYELDLSSCTTCYRAFYNCTSLYSAPYLNNIRTGGNFQQMFWNCSSLRILPLYNLGSPSNLENMFQGTGSNLEEASRINILIMLAACTYSGTKTLAHLGFTASMYSAASWQALPHYNDFVSAGWSIGYN